MSEAPHDPAKVETPESPDEGTESASAPVDSGEDWAILDTLNERERKFVYAALQGKDWTDCALIGGWSGALAPIRVLGRPRVREVIQRLAPLAMAMDPKIGARLTMPYWGKRLIETAVDGSDAQATGAAKELASIAGIGAKDRDVRASLADALGVLAQRISDARPKQLPKRATVIDVTPAPASDSKSGALDASIWDVPSGAQQSKPEAGRPAGKGRGKRGRG